jgi:autotransporter-associated beta strand protein
MAQNATWTGLGAEWTTNGNWSPNSVPSNTATFTNNGAPSSVTISSSTSINEIFFSSNAPPYSFTVQGGATVFSIEGAGVVNDSSSTQSFTNNSANISFGNSSTAGNAFILNAGTGNLEFTDTSTAGNASITNNFEMGFFNAATAGNATITNTTTGLLGFFNASTAGSATIITDAFLGFHQTSTAGNATLIDNAGGIIDFSASTGPNNDGKLSAGSIQGSGTFYLGADQLSVGSNNLSTTVSGVISDCGVGGTQCDTSGATGGSLVKVGTGTLTLSGANTYTGSTNVDAGALEVDGSIASSSLTTVNSGGTIGGIGTIGDLILNGGGTLMPGMPGSTGTLNVNGNLTFASGSNYVITINGIAASKTDVSGAATLNSGASVKIASGSTIDAKNNYTILTASGGVSGAFSPTGTYGAYDFTLSYNTNDVFLTFSPANLAALLPPGAPTNVVNVANAIDTAFTGGATLPPAFQDLFGLSGPQLENALTQLSGEAATGARQSGFQMMNSFMSLLLDPYADNRGGGGFGAGTGPAPLGYAAVSGPQLPPAMAEAYASVLREPAAPPAPHWNVWGASFGGANENAGTTSVGSHDTSTGAAGFAIGVDDYVAPGTMLGFALAGGGTDWSLSQGLGGGRSDVFQAGLYGVHEFGPAYVAGALSFGNYWVSTNHNVAIIGGGALQANFDAQGYGGRFESGYHVPIESVTLTPYVAVQPQAFAQPASSEFAASGSSTFALNYNAQTGTEVRGELGTWLSKTLDLANGDALNLFGRAAWAHDWQSNPNLTADFLALPAASFVVNGAEPPADLALITAGAELRLAGGWSLMAKFEGEFGKGSETYTGTGRLAYSW